MRAHLIMGVYIYSDGATASRHTCYDAVPDEGWAMTFLSLHHIAGIEKGYRHDARASRSEYSEMIYFAASLYLKARYAAMKKYDGQQLIRAAPPRPQQIPYPLFSICFLSFQADGAKIEICNAENRAAHFRY